MAEEREAAAVVVTINTVVEPVVVAVTIIPATLPTEEVVVAAAANTVAEPIIAVTELQPEEIMEHKVTIAEQ